ncbi:hypothetical protein [Streptomyces sp. SYSU K21746]
MGRRALIRSGVAVATTFGLALGLAPLGAVPALADTPPEAVIKPVSGERPYDDVFSLPGATGHLYRAEGATAYEWRSYDGKTTWPLPQSPLLGRAAVLPDGSEVVAHTLLNQRDTLQVFDTGTGRTTAHTLPEGHRFVRAVGTADGLLTVTGYDGRVGLLTGTGGNWSVREVQGLPAGALNPMLQAADAKGGLLAFHVGADYRYAWIDFASGQATWSKSWPSATARPAATAVNDQYFALYEGGAVQVVSRTDPAAGHTVALPALPVSDGSYRIALTADSVLAARLGAKPTDGIDDPLYAVPVGGGDARTVLPEVSSLFGAPDGGVLVVGGAGISDWAARRIAPGASAPAEFFKIGTNRPVRYGLSLSRGKLSSRPPNPRRSGWSPGRATT